MTRSQKKIVIISSLVLLSTLIAEVLSYIGLHISADRTSHTALVALNFSVFALRPLDYSFRQSILTRGLGHTLDFLDYFPWLITALLAIGTVLFSINKAGGIRLLRFTYSIYLLFHVSYLFIYIGCQLYLWLHLSTVHIHNEPLYSILFSWACHIGWICLSIFVLNQLKPYTRLRLVSSQYGEQFIDEFVAATKWQRLLHAVIDGILLILTILCFIEVFFWLWSAGGLFDGYSPLFIRVVAMAMALCIRMFYLIAFEALWSATPAKFLTGTMVIDDKGHKPTFKTIIERSFSRLIPFDEFSFFGWRGWHDRISDTWVCKEEVIK